MEARTLGFNTKLIHSEGPKGACGGRVTAIRRTSIFAFENARQGGDAA
jgi:hypothetical protein